MPRAQLPGSVELEYEVIGEGRPLLLIGGLGAQLISWDDAMCDALAARGYAVIRYDHRDSGLSTSFDELGVPDLLGLLVGGGRAPYLLDDMAGDAVALLDHLGVEQADLLGLSLGGMIAQLIALDRPERVNTLVAALSGPPGRPSQLPAPPVIEALLTPPASTFDERVEQAVTLRRVLAGEPADFDAQVARERAAAQITRAYQPAGTIRQAAAVLGTPNRLSELKQMSTPALVIHGRRDPLIAFESAQSAADAMPNSIFVAVPALGHDLPPTVARQLIDQISEFHRWNKAAGSLNNA